MKSTEEAWMQFNKSESEVVPIKDVSLEGKLDTIAAQLNKIEVDSARVASTVPEILGDKGVEEALKQEEDDVPELPNEEESSEEKSEDPEAEEKPAEGETVGDSDNPEGIFTDDPEAEEKSEEVPEEGAEGEAPAEDAEADGVKPVADDAPAETAVQESDEEPAPEAPAEEAVEGEPTEKDGEAPAGEPEAESEEPAPEKGAEAEAEAEPAPEKEDVAEGESDEEIPEDEPKVEGEVVVTEDGEKVVVPKKKVVAKSAFMQMVNPASAHKGSAFMEIMNGIKKDDAPSESIQEEAGGVGAGSAGASNAVYGKVPSDATEVDTVEEIIDEHKACKSAFIMKYGTPGHTGVWQRSEKARTNSDNPCYAPDGIKNTKRHNWTDKEREERDQKPRRVSNPGSGESYRTHGGSPDKARRRAKQRYHEIHSDAKYRGKDGKMHGGKQNLRSTTRNHSNAKHGDNWGGRTGVVANNTRNKGRDNVKGYSRKKSFLDFVGTANAVKKSSVVEQVEAQTASVSTALPTQKHIPTMQEVYVAQRPATVATVNGDITRTRLGDPFELRVAKSEPAQVSLNPTDFLNTASDWKMFYSKGKL